MNIVDLKKTPPAEVIKITLDALKTGGLIIFPTETTYGAGVDATNLQAVQKLLSYKSRREGKPLSIAVPNEKTAAHYVKINEQAHQLYQRFLPGPVTIISHSLGKVAAGVASEFETLGVRIPDYPLILQILAAFDKPITATSANASGKKRPYQINDVLQNISTKQKNLIDLILDAGQLPTNQPSTVIDTTLSTPTTLRIGKVKNKNLHQLTSNSESETKKIAGTLLLKNWNKIKRQGLMIGLAGSLGAGKTVFAKGVAQFLKISEEITSPTYAYIEEYDYLRHGVSGKLYHLDLWKIETPQELARLEIAKLLGPNNVVVIEWWQQGARPNERKYSENNKSVNEKSQLKPDLKILIEETKEKNDKLRKIFINLP